MNHLLTFTVSYEKKVCTGAHGCHPVSSKFDIFHINLGPHSFDLFGSQETKKKIICYSVAFLKNNGCADHKLRFKREIK